MVNHRTAVVSQIRGLLIDRGFTIAKSITRARRAIPEILAGQDNELTAMARDAIAELYDLFRDLDRRIGLFDKKTDRVFRESEARQRIARIKGVGPKTATAIVAAIGDGSEFKNGRHLAAWVGLVPRQFSSGDRKVLMGISKRGNQHLRSLLVHGARAVVRTAPRKTDLNNQWVNQLRERRGFNRATETTNTQRFEADSLAGGPGFEPRSTESESLRRVLVCHGLKPGKAVFRGCQ